MLDNLNASPDITFGIRKDLSGFLTQYFSKVIMVGFQQVKKAL